MTGLKDLRIETRICDITGIDSLIDCYDKLGPTKLTSAAVPHRLRGSICELGTLSARFPERSDTKRRNSRKIKVELNIVKFPENSITYYFKIQFVVHEFRKRDKAYVPIKQYIIDVLTVYPKLDYKEYRNIPTLDSLPGGCCACRSSSCDSIYTYDRRIVYKQLVPSIIIHSHLPQRMQYKEDRNVLPKYKDEIISNMCDMLNNTVSFINITRVRKNSRTKQDYLRIYPDKIDQPDNLFEHIHENYLNTTNRNYVHSLFKGRGIKFGNSCVIIYSSGIFSFDNASIDRNTVAKTLKARNQIYIVKKMDELKKAIGEEDGVEYN
jgi:hypothetical protein